MGMGSVLGDALNQLLLHVVQERHVRRRQVLEAVNGRAGQHEPMQARLYTPASRAVRAGDRINVGARARPAPRAARRGPVRQRSCYLGILVANDNHVGRFPDHRVAMTLGVFSMLTEHAQPKGPGAAGRAGSADDRHRACRDRQLARKLPPQALRDAALVAGRYATRAGASLRPVRVCAQARPRAGAGGRPSPAVQARRWRQPGDPCTPSSAAAPYFLPRRRPGTRDTNATSSWR